MFKPSWSEAEAQHRFGEAAKEPGHGHLYRVAVTVGGQLDPETGTLIDLALLDALIARVVINPLDGQDLNRVVPEFSGGESCPSCEALAAVLFHDLARGLPDTTELCRVVVAEDETLEAECRAESSKGGSR